MSETCIIKFDQDQNAECALELCFHYTNESQIQHFKQHSKFQLAMQGTDSFGIIMRLRLIVIPMKDAYIVKE